MLHDINLAQHSHPIRHAHLMNPTNLLTHLTPLFHQSSSCPAENVGFALTRLFRPIHSDPFNLSLPAYSNKGGIVDAADYNWDASYVGQYERLDPPTSTLSDLVIPDTISLGMDVPLPPQPDDEVVMGLQNKYGQDGGAPMLSTPNCK